MFKTLRSAFAALLLALPLPAFARPAADADPALWVVRDKDTTIYLFGTIHVLKPGLQWFDDAVKTAFDASDTLVQELVFPDPAATQAIVAKYSISSDPVPLSQRVPAAKRAAYDAAVAGTGVPAAAFDRMKPWSAANNLTVLTLLKQGYDLNSGVEKQLSAAAAKDGKNVVGLETLETQLGYFDSIAASAQLSYLEATIDELPKAGSEISTMVDRWSRGDPKALAKSMNETMLATPELGKLLLTDRNARWAQWIKARMAQPGTVFVAVGAGHLAGKGSVQEQLKGLKLKAKRIKY